MKERVEVVDWSVYGALLHNRRVKAGFKNMDDFMQALWHRARVTTSKDTMYKIEKGAVPPPAEIMLGINLVLFGSRNDDTLLQMAVCDEWKEAEEYYQDYAFKENGFNLSRPYVSEKWAAENRKEVRDRESLNNEYHCISLEDNKGGGYEVWPEMTLTPEECSELTNEPIPVFQCIHDLSIEP